MDNLLRVLKALAFPYSIDFFESYLWDFALSALTPKVQAMVNCGLHILVLLRKCTERATTILKKKKKCHVTTSTGEVCALEQSQKFILFLLQCGPDRPACKKICDS